MPTVRFTDDADGRLAIGSTSGGPWISENGGDSWVAPDARLPPIHAVRFVGRAPGTIRALGPARRHGFR